MTKREFIMRYVIHNSSNSEYGNWGDAIEDAEMIWKAIEKRLHEDVPRETLDL